MDLPEGIQFRFWGHRSGELERHILDAFYHGVIVARLEWLNGKLTYEVTDNGKLVGIDECYDLPVIMEKELMKRIEESRKRSEIKPSDEDLRAIWG
jgi:hypothetical protein